MTLTTPVADLDIVEILSAEDEPPCMTDGCSEVARWATRCWSCRTDWMHCDRHRTRIDALALGVPGVLCGRNDGTGGCAAVMFFPLPWRPI